MPLAITAAVGVLILLACAFMFASRNGLWLRARLEPHLTPVRKRAKARRRQGRRAVLRRILLATEQTFANVKQFRRLQRLLQRADLPLRAAELLYICLGAGILAALVGAVAGLPFLFLIFMMGLGGSLPVLFVSVKAKARVKAFDNQLPDMLITIAATLKAGHSFRQAI